MPLWFRNLKAGAKWNLFVVQVFCSANINSLYTCLSLQEPLPEAAALLLRHPGICSVWGYGSLLSDGGVPHPVRHVNALTAHYLPFLQYLLPRSLLPSLNFTRRGVSRTETQNELVGHSDQWGGKKQQENCPSEGNMPPIKFICSCAYFCFSEILWDLTWLKSVQNKWLG